ncbi:MAG: hypothetical protein ACXVUL_17635 [Solirubrobacteraceae bacterium]
MGTNLMCASRRNRVIEVARETVGRHLHQADVRAQLATLPPGRPELVSRPRRPLRRPLPFARLARERWEPVVRGN